MGIAYEVDCRIGGPGCLGHPPDHNPAHKVCKNCFNQFVRGTTRNSRPSWITYLLNTYERERYYRTVIGTRFVSLDQLLEDPAFDETSLKKVVAKSSTRRKRKRATHEVRPVSSESQGDRRESRIRSPAQPHTLVIRR